MSHIPTYQTKSLSSVPPAKAGDPLAASFDALADVATLKRDVAALKGRLRASSRPALSVDGVKGLAAQDDPARAAFVDRYLRRGLETGVELKSFTGATGAEGGYAVPREIDAVIDAALKSISPIRAVANVVQTGSAGYRKLVTTGGTPSGWAGETAARPLTATRPFRKSPRRWASFTPILPPRKRCLMMRLSMSKAGWRAKSRPNLRAPKGRRSSPAMASTSPKAF